MDFHITEYRSNDKNGEVMVYLAFDHILKVEKWFWDDNANRFGQIEGGPFNTAEEAILDFKTRVEKSSY